jgi:hypothetical protein
MIHADIVLKQTGENVLTGGAIYTVRIVAARLAPVLLRCKMGIGLSQAGRHPALVSEWRTAIVCHLKTSSG